jgi:cation transport regulator ChaC
MYYFAYGSNMNPDRVLERGLAVVSVAGAVLEGVSLAFNKRSRDHTGGHANIVYAPADRVEGVLYGLRDVDQIQYMDRFEKTPVNYSRERVIVRTASGAEAAWTYVANRAVIVEGLKPARAYLNHLLAGRSYLSAEYYAWLAGSACVDD